MSNRFPALRPQAMLSHTTRPAGRPLPSPSTVDLTILATLIFLVVLALA